MALARHANRLLLLAAGAFTLATIVWASFLFVGVWLRHRCVRELAALAKPLETVKLQDEDSDVAAGSVLAFLSDGDELSGLRTLVSRIEDLQRPSPRTIFKQLFGPRAEPQPAHAMTSYAVSSIGLRWSGPVTSSSEVVLAGSQDAPESAPAPSDAVSAPTGDESTPTAASQAQVVVASGQLELASVQFQPTAVTYGATRALRLWIAGRLPDGLACHAVTDASGEKLWLVVLPRGESDSSGSGGTESSAGKQRLLVVDSGGNIIGRFPSPAGVLLGRLDEPRGHADQLVFGSEESVRADAESGRIVAAPRTIVVIENGRPKVIEPVAPAIPTGGAQSSP